MKRLLILFAILILSWNYAQAQLVKNVKTINVIPDNASIMIAGVEVATGTYNLSIGKQDYVVLRLSAPGYIDKTVRVYKSDRSKTLTYKLLEDEACSS